MKGSLEATEYDANGIKTQFHYKLTCGKRGCNEFIHINETDYGKAESKAQEAGFVYSYSKLGWVCSDEHRPSSY